MSGHADTIRRIVEVDVPRALGYHPTWTKEHLAALGAERHA